MILFYISFGVDYLCCEATAVTRADRTLILFLEYRAWFYYYSFDANDNVYY